MIITQSIHSTRHMMTFTFRLLTMSVCCLVMGMSADVTLGQTTPPADAKSLAPTNQEVADSGISFSDPVETSWEFGLQITATSNTLRIKSTIPVPMDWPEQSVVLLGEQKSNNVGKLVFKDNTDHAKQLSFKIRRMAGGQRETVLVRYKIIKKMIIAPQDTSQFVLTKTIPKNVKTFLKHSPLIESNHRRIREIAETLKDEDLNAWEQVETIFRWVRDNIEYKFDTQNHSCLEALDAQRGDCGELSSLFIAICRAQGIPARAVWIPDHTYPEFYLSDKDGNGHWFPCQAAGTYEFGSMTETKPILHKGDRFKIDGERKQVRYLRPTLVAGSGSATIGWIHRQIRQQDGAKGSRDN